MNIDDLPGRLRSKIVVDEAGCWLWTGSHTNAGYATYTIRRHTTTAHRVVYELLVGTIGDGLELDHLCRNCGCVNPGHVEQVTHDENMRRYAATRTTCSHGHEYTPENTGRYRGWRTCRACNRRKAKERYYRLKNAT